MLRLARFIFIVAIALSSAALVPKLQAQELEWDHAKCDASLTLQDSKCTPILRVVASPGETIKLTIKNTCPESFTYSFVSVPSDSLRIFATGCSNPKVISIVHEALYGGYIVYAEPVQGTTPERGSARITISVHTRHWQVGFGGGFTLNGLTQPAWALTPVDPATTPSSYTVTAEPSRRDRVGRSVASFVHLSRTGRDNAFVRPALTFGLGVEPDRTGDYYLGLSLLAGDQAALTFGAVFGSEQTLPAGRRVGDVVTDANALSTLGSRRVGRFFFGLSYSFLGGSKEDFQKPFKSGKEE